MELGLGAYPQGKVPEMLLGALQPRTVVEPHAVAVSTSSK